MISTTITAKRKKNPILENFMKCHLLLPKKEKIVSIVVNTSAKSGKEIIIIDNNGKIGLNFFLRYSFGFYLFLCLQVQTLAF